MRPSRSTVVIAAATALWLSGLGAYPLLESTEGRYASVAWSMAHGASWIEPAFNGAPLFTKPPLAYWAGATALMILPDHEWAVRLPSTLMLLACFWLTRRFALLVGLDRRRARWAGALAVLSPLAFAQGHMTTGDIFLWAGSLLAICCLFDDRSGTLPRAALLGLGLAVGFMVKGHMVLFWVVLPTAVWAATPRGSWRRLGRLLHPVTLLVFAGLTAPWFAVVLHRNPDLMGYWLGSETADRFLTTTHGRHEAWWYFLPQVPMLMLLWLPELRRGLMAAGAFTREHRWFLLAWVVVPLLIFTFSGSKRPNYLLPMITPLAVLAAAGVPAVAGRSLRWRTGGWAALLLILPIGFGLGGFGPPTRNLVADARATGRPLVAYRDAPTATVFYNRGPIAIYRGNESGDNGPTLADHVHGGGLVLLPQSDVPLLSRVLDGENPVVIAAGGRFVLVASAALHN